MQKIFSNIFSRFIGDFRESKQRSIDLVGDMTDKLKNESQNHWIVDVINPILILTITSLGFIGSLISSGLGTLIFINPFHPLFSGLLARFKREPIIFLLLGILVLAIGFGYLNSAIAGKLMVYYIVLTLFELLLACLFFHYFLKYRTHKKSY